METLLREKYSDFKNIEQLHFLSIKNKLVTHNQKSS